MQCEFQGINHIDHIFSMTIQQAFLQQMKLTAFYHIVIQLRILIMLVKKCFFLGSSV